MTDHIIIPESNIHVQEKTQWCYAAIAQLIIQHYEGRLIPQSEIVQRVMATATPTSRPDEKKNGDNIPQDPYKYLKNEMKHIRSVVNGEAPDPYVIRTEIDKNRPIIVRVGNAGSGHYMLIVGYSDTPPAASRKGGRMNISISRVFYIDPLQKKYTIESGSDANSRVECEYEDAKSGTTKRAKDNITGYYLTSLTGLASAAASDVATSPKTSKSPEKTSTGKSSKIKPKSKKGGRRSRMRKPVRKSRHRRTIRR